MMEALSPANIGLLLFGIFFVLLLIGSRSWSPSALRPWPASSCSTLTSA